MKLQKGDTVMVRSGKDKGKTGKILQVYPALNKVVVDGINVLKRTTKPSAKQPRGGLISQPRPLNASKVGIVHPNGKKTSRIGIVVAKDGKKGRVYRQAANKEIKS